MKLNIKANDLKEVIAPMLKAIPAKPVCDTHLYIRFAHTDREGLTLTSTDGNTFVVCSPECPHTVTESGEMLLYASVLHGLVDTLGNSEVSIEDRQGFILVKWPSGNASLPLTDASAFPRPALLTESETLSLHIVSADLQEAIRHTRFACSDDPLKDNMRSVLIDTGNGECNVVSTDGHMLTRYSIKPRGLGAFPTQFIIPCATADIVRHILDDSDDDVTVGHDSRTLSITKGQFTVLTSRKNQNYPDWNALAGMTRMNSRTLKVKREVFEKAVRRIAIFSDKSCPTLKITLGQNRDITFFSENQSINLSASELLYEGRYDGEPMELGLQPDNLLKILTNTKAEFVTMKINEPRTPVVISPDESSSTEAFSAVMATKL